MMKEENSSQLELFSGTREQFLTEASFSSAFLGFLKTFEKTILLVIAFIIVSVVCFCLGVEKGKGLGTQVLNTPINPPVKIAVPVVPATEKKVLPLTTIHTQVKPVVEKQSTTQPEQRIKELPLVYTIQVASYENKDNAQLEAQALRKIGLTPVLATRGKYTIVCVGKFDSKETAQPLWAKLKKQYQGCILRRL